MQVSIRSEEEALHSRATVVTKYLHNLCACAQTHYGKLPSCGTECLLLNMTALQHEIQTECR